MPEDREPDLEDLVRLHRWRSMADDRRPSSGPAHQRVPDPTMDKLAAEFGEPLWVHLELHTRSGWVLSRREFNDVDTIRELTTHGWVEVEPDDSP